MSIVDDDDEMFRVWEFAGIRIARAETSSLWIISFFHIFAVAFSPFGRWIDATWCE